MAPKEREGKKPGKDKKSQKQKQHRNSDGTKYSPVNEDDDYDDYDVEDHVPGTSAGNIEKGPLSINNVILEGEESVEVITKKVSELIVENAKESLELGEETKMKTEQKERNISEYSVGSQPVGEAKIFDETGSDYLETFVLDNVGGQAKPLIDALSNYHDQKKLVKWAKLDRELRKFAATRCVTKIVHIPWIIRFIYDWRISWETMIFILSLLTYVFITYSCFFGYYEKNIWASVFIIDLLFGFDVILRLGLQIWRHSTLVPCSVLLMPYSAEQSLLDVMALIPMERIYILLVPGGAESLSALNYVDLMRMNRFLRFGRIFKYFNVMKFEGRGNQSFMFICEYMVWYCSFIHFMACIFFVMLDLTPLDYLLSLKRERKGWISNILLKPGFNRTPQEQYVLSLGFSTAVVTTVGYGDFFPRYLSEMVVCIAVMLIGAIVLTGNFASVLTTFELETDGARFDIFHRYQAINRHMVAIKCAPLLREKIKEYYELLWNYRQGVFDVVMFHYLPSSMQEDILYDISREMFHKSSFFRDLDESFLRAVARIVRVILFNSKMILCEAENYAVNMYYIIQGEVNVRSRLDRGSISTVLRAGSIIGEINLFFSCPYDMSYETRTACQFLQIKKQDLMALFRDYNDTLHIMRGKVQSRLKTMKKVYHMVGKHPITWAEKDEHLTKKEMQIFTDHPVELRWLTKFNPKVLWDIPNDALCTIIAEQTCRDPSFKKSHSVAFETCMVAPILDCEYEWARRWDKIVMVITLAYSFLGPYCFVFGASSEFDVYLLQIENGIQYPVIIAYIVDVFVEIGTACPVTGIYFKMRDGIQIRIKEFGFWIDVAAAVPLRLFEFTNHQEKTIFTLLPKLIHCLKLWKIVRYLKYLENKHPKKIFWFRLMHTVLALMYGVHIIACSLFFSACPTHRNAIVCRSRTWLTSYEISNKYHNGEMFPKSTVTELVSEMPYLLSFFYATATLTSAGFGDFNPKNQIEILWSIFFQLVGFLLIGYYTSILTSALACTVRPMLAFQQKISTVITFMEHIGLSENLSKRVTHHYRLQHQLMDGIILPKNFNILMFDCPKKFTDDILLQEVELFLDGVPIFTKADAKVLIKIAEKMRRLVIPMHTTILRRGECRRTLYVVVKGSVAVTNVESTIYKEIIEATGHFGLRDLLYGEPSAYNIRTLSDCFVWAIDFENFRNAFLFEEETLDWVLEEKKKMQVRVEAMQQVYDAYDPCIFYDDLTAYIPNWNKLASTTFQSYDHCTYEEYIEPFRQLRPITHKLCRFFLMARTIHPAGTFARVWTSFMSFMSCLTIIFLLVEHLMWLRTRSFRTVQIICNLMAFVDVYMKMHWGYFSENDVVIIHPLKTAARYISKGSFFGDICFCVPYELIIYFAGGTTILGYGPGATWYSTFRWTRLFQIFRIHIIFKNAHSRFVNRSTVLVILYVLMTAALCTGFATVAVYLGCPFPSKDWEEGDENRMPMCLENTLALSLSGIDSSNLDVFWERWSVGLYYVTQVILVIGYGDMITLNRGELYLTIILMVFGFLITRCIIADITAAEVDSDLTRDEYTGRLNNLMFIMKREKVHKKLIECVQIYFFHTWLKCKCYQASIAFQDLHFSLKADLFQEFVGERMASIPLFEGLSTNALRALCTQFKKYYFVRGQHIVRYGNMEFDMFIFTKGIIWLLDKNSDYVMNLNPGQTFGEVSMMYLIPRKYSIVAGSDVEALTLDPDGYEAVIECYPSVKRCFEDKMRKSNFRDLFEVEMAKMKQELTDLSETEIHSKTVEDKYRSDFIKDLISIREPPNLLGTNFIFKPPTGIQRIKKLLYGFGVKDNRLPYFYFVADKADPAMQCKFLIHPNCGFMTFFNNYITWYCYISPAIMLYVTCFPCNNCPMLRYSAKAELVMILFIIVQFFTPFQTDDMEFCKNYWEIVAHYLYSPSLFLLDFITTLPFEYIHSVFDGYKFMMLIRILRLVRFYREQFKKKQIFSLTTFRFKITVSIASFFLVAHMLACLFYFISSCKEVSTDKYKCRDRTWTDTYVSDEGIPPFASDHAWKWYVVSIYWVVTTVSTTGFGDVGLSNPYEMGVAVVTIFCGAFVLSVILSHFGAGFASLSKMFREYIYQVKLLLKHATVIGLSKKQHDNIVAYFLMLWHGCKGVSYDKTTAVLPETLRIDVCYSLYSKVIEKSRIFAEVGDKTFVAQVCSRLTHSMCLPGMTIETQGDLGDSLYIVFKGKVAAYTRNIQGQFKVTRGYVAGNIFGVLPAFFCDQEYSYTYRAETFTEILKLSQSDIYQLAANYPKFSAICQILILGKGLTRDVKLEDCIFSEERSIKRGLFEIETKQWKKDKKEVMSQVEIEKSIVDAVKNMTLNVDDHKKLTEGLMAKARPMKSRVVKKVKRVKINAPPPVVKQKWRQSITRVITAQSRAPPRRTLIRQNSISVPAKRKSATSMRGGRVTKDEK